MTRKRSREGTAYYEYLEKIRPDRARFILALPRSEFLSLFSGAAQQQGNAGSDEIPGSVKADGTGKWWEPATFDWYYGSVMKMLSEHARSNYKGVERKYKPKSGGDGRAHVVGFGLQLCHSKLRNFLAEGLLRDYDMVNAHPSLLLDLSKEWGLQLPALAKYVENRAACLDEMQLSKKDILVRLNLDNPRGSGKTELERKLMAEFAEARTFAYGKFAEDHPTKNKDNPKASVLNKILNIRENGVLAEKVKAIDGLKVCIPMFDGFLTDLQVPNVDGATEGSISWKEKPIVNNITVDGVDGGAADTPENREGGRNDEVNANRILSGFKGRIFQTSTFGTFGLMMYDARGGFWTFNPMEHKRLVHERSADLLVDNSKNGDKTFRTLYSDAYSLVTCKAPMLRFDEFLGKSKGKLLFRNGVLDMRTFEMLPHDPGFYFFHRIDRDYDVNHFRKDTSLVEEVRTRIFDKPFTDEEKRNYVIEFYARALAGHIEDRRCMALLGQTKTGKGKQTSLLQKAAGDFVGSFNTEAIVSSAAKANREPALQWGWLRNGDLYLTRLMIANEVEMTNDHIGHRTKTRPLNGNAIKRLVSGGTDDIQMRDLYQPQIKCPNQATMIMLANDLPKVNPADDALLDRFSIVEFDRSASSKIKEDNETHFVGDDSIDSFVERIDVCDAFICLLCIYYAETIKEGKSVLMPKPDCVISATHERATDGGGSLEDWLWKRYEKYSGDVVQDFGNGKISTKGEPLFDKAKVKDWYVTFRSIHDEWGADGNKVTTTEFGRQLKRLGLYKWDTRINVDAGKWQKVDCYVGIRAMQEGADDDVQDDSDAMQDDEETVQEDDAQDDEEMAVQEEDCN